MFEAARDPRPGPEAVTAALERHRQLLAALRRLPVGQRQVLALALEGLAQREIAEVVGISESNVAVRLHRARGALRAELEASKP
ncbi:MAG: sigma-70 family RNA polymerase sigma factor [Thermoanaerobaculia bacterium]|nr:sigma-70 family RNA polymerase sigma factor [Thermoanaerobaculia bacterium]